MYGGINPLERPVGFDQHGNPSPYGDAWTGSDAFGFPAVLEAWAGGHLPQWFDVSLGTTAFTPETNEAGLGSPQSTAFWLTGGTSSTSSQNPLYALSGPITMVPEPASLATAAIGLVGFIAWRRRTGFGKAAILGTLAVASAVPLAGECPAAAYPVSNSYFDLPATGLPTSTATDPLAVPGWTANLSSTVHFAGVREGSDLPGHSNVLYIKNTEGFSSDFWGPIRVYQRLENALHANTIYTLTVGVRISGEVLGLIGLAGPPDQDFHPGQPLWVGSDQAGPFGADGGFADVATSFTTPDNIEALGSDLWIWLSTWANGIDQTGEAEFRDVRLDVTPVPEPGGVILAASAVGLVFVPRLLRRGGFFAKAASISTWPRRLTR